MRIVLAEHELLLREGMESLLERSGFEVVGQAGDAVQLLALVRATSPDLVVVDIRMPPTRTREGLEAAGLTVYGGRNAPYIWLKTPSGFSSWDFFDKLLNEAHVVGTPGPGFGPSGEGYFRLTGFGGRDQTEEAVARIKTRLK